MKYFNKYRIRWWVSALFQILLFAAVYLPTVTLIGNQSSSFSVDIVSQSALWYLANAGYPGVYDTLLTFYILLSLPLLIFGFLKGLKRFPIMVAAVTDIIYMAANLLLTVFIYSLGITGNFAVKTSFTVWFWLYIAVQTAQIVHLFILFFQMKKARN